jgi:hypothetical protein
MEKHSIPNNLTLEVVVEKTKEEAEIQLAIREYPGIGTSAAYNEFYTVRQSLTVTENNERHSTGHPTTT